MDDLLTLEIRVMLAGLATFRLASLITQDDGPFRLIARLRAWIGRRAASARGRGVWWTVGELFHCPFCFGVHIALACAFLIFFPTIGGDLFLLMWGLSGAQALMEGIGGRSR